MVALPLPIAHHLNPRHWLGWNGMKTYRNIQIGEGFNVFYSTSGENGWIALAGCQTKMSVNGFLSPLMMYAIMMIVFFGIGNSGQ
jgi:hypothetical protein